MKKIYLLFCGPIILTPLMVTTSCTSLEDSFNADVQYDGTNSHTSTSLQQNNFDLSQIKASEVNYDTPIENFVNVVNGDQSWLINPLKYSYKYSSKYPNRVNYSFRLNKFKDLSGTIVEKEIYINVSINGFQA